MFSIKMYCDKCFGKKNASCESMKFLVKNEIGKYESIYLKFLICNDCGEKYIVQIDNEFTNNLLERQKRIMYEIGTKKCIYGASNKKIKKMENKVNTISKRLMSERNELVLKYNNTEYYDDNLVNVGIIDFKENIPIEIV